MLGGRTEVVGLERGKGCLASLGCWSGAVGLGIFGYLGFQTLVKRPAIKCQNLNGIQGIGGLQKLLFQA
jgi:hypothetical protein